MTDLPARRYIFEYALQQRAIAAYDGRYYEGYIAGKTGCSLNIPYVTYDFRITEGEMRGRYLHGLPASNLRLGSALNLTLVKG